MGERPEKGIPSRWGFLKGKKKKRSSRRAPGGRGELKEDRGGAVDAGIKRRLGGVMPGESPRGDPRVWKKRLDQKMPMPAAGEGKTTWAIKFAKEKWREMCLRPKAGNLGGKKSKIRLQSEPRGSKKGKRKGWRGGKLVGQGETRRGGKRYG